MHFWFGVLLLLGVWASAGQAAAIQHAFAEQNTNQTTTSSSYSDVSGLSIASGSFTAGKKYLIVITAQVNTNGDNSAYGVQTVHGSTAFAESEGFLPTSNAPWHAVYQFFTVWTAVSSEGIKIQFKSNGSATLNLNFGSIFTMNLSDNVVENTDWCYNERANDDSVSEDGINFTSGAGCTLTTAASDWLVLSYFQGTDTVVGEAETRIDHTGTASETTPNTSYQPRGTGNSKSVRILSRVFTLTNVSNTFTEQAMAWGGSWTRLHSAIFMLNLAKFKNYSFAYTNADTAALSTTDYATQVQTVSITPSVVSDVWLLGEYSFKHNDTGEISKMRLQLDNSDQPTGQTTAAYNFQWDDTAVGFPPITLSTLAASMSAASHTIGVDASDLGGGGTFARRRALVAVTMELAATSSGSTRRASPIIFQ